MTIRKLLITSISPFDPSPFKALGYEPVRASTVKLLPDSSAVGRLRRGILEKRFDSIAFLSPRAIDILYPDGSLLNVLSAMRIYALGPSTRRSLERYNLRVAGIPSEYTSTALADLIASENSKAPFNKIAIVRSSFAGLSFAERLMKSGVCAEEHRIYKGVPDIDGICLFLHELDIGIWAAVFTSSSSILTVIEYLKSCDKVWRFIETLKNVRIIAMGPETAKSLRSVGLDAEVLKVHSMDGLILHLRGDLL